MNAVLSCLPPRAAEILLKYEARAPTEIRLRADRPMTVTVDGNDLATGLSLTRDELKDVVLSLCGGSLHSCRDAIREGYLPLPDGGRAGLCGTYSGGEVTDVTSICLRIPRTVRGIGAGLCRALTDRPGAGLLLYSPPGEGKTTLLRDIAATLSSPPYRRRVALIDSRRELYREELFRRSLVDLYLGYPKGTALEQAIRTMSPQYLVCDEIGPRETEAVLTARSAGVPLIASAHAPSFEALRRRPDMRELLDAGLFSLTAGLSRRGGALRLTVREDGRDLAIDPPAGGET